MSSQSSTHTPQEQQGRRVVIHFCKDCGNLQYPTQRRSDNSLFYMCRTCLVSERAVDYMVFRTAYNPTIDQAEVNVEVVEDPTLPRAVKTCPNCGEDEAVFFQGHRRSKDSPMLLCYVCCNCRYVH